MKAVAADKVREIVERLPTTRDEDWKYTDLSRARDISTRWLEAGAVAPCPSLDEKIEAITGSIEAAWFVFCNGELTAVPTAEGVTSEKLDAAPVGHTALAELNAALLRDGLRLHIDGALTAPIGLLFVDGGETPTVSQGYVEIIANPSALAELIEYHASVGDADQYANTAVSIEIGDNASIRHLRIQDRNLDHVQTGRTSISIGRDARFHSASFDLGGGLIRNDLDIDIANPGAEVSFDGLYLAATANTSTTIRGSTTVSVQRRRDRNTAAY